jgi:hypothetical protein
MALFGLVEILVIFLIMILIAGIALLVLGLIFKRKPLWVSGIVITALSLTIGIGAISVALFTLGETRKYAYENNYNDQDLNQQQPVDSVEPAINDTSLLQQFDLPVSGVLKDADNNMVEVKVYPDKYLAKRGIRLLFVNNARMGKDKIGISLEFGFDKAFKGKMMLQIYDFYDKELSNNVLEVSQQNSGRINLDFRISDNIHFSDIKYCTINAFE